jgi:hypothetical protein
LFVEDLDVAFEKRNVWKRLNGATLVIPDVELDGVPFAKGAAEVLVFLLWLLGIDLNFLFVIAIVIIVLVGAIAAVRPLERAIAAVAASPTVSATAVISALPRSVSCWTDGGMAGCTAVPWELRDWDTTGFDDTSQLLQAIADSIVRCRGGICSGEILELNTKAV